LIDLPKPKEIKVVSINLRDCIENRQSIRKYSDNLLSLSELSWLLWCTQGIREDSPRVVTLRNVPSAGARHAFETFLLVNRVESLTPGIYRYIATKHKLLELIIEKDIAEKATEAALDQSAVKNSAVTFIWVAVPYRMTWRYGERGYRYLLLDAGHVCQNLYLAAENISCGVCAIAAYHDEAFNQLLDLDGEEKFVIYLATVGKKK
jgi:SagB-type dehydrogenase family enzyme